MNVSDEATMRSAEVHLNPTSAAPGDARRFIAELLEDHDALEQAKLIASELVTNAVQHGGRDAGHVTMVVSRESAPGRIRIEVSQASHDGFTFQDRKSGHLGLTGRGLLIVDSVASEWGVDSDTGSVWVVLG